MATKKEKENYKKNPEGFNPEQIKTINKQLAQMKKDQDNYSFMPTHTYITTLKDTTKRVKSLMDVIRKK